MQHPEYLYWAILVAFGVPAVVVARSVVPLLVAGCSLIDAAFWGWWPSAQAEGLMLSVLYGGLLCACMKVRLDAAETMAVALWSPMMVCALAQCGGANPVVCFWAIYWLAIAQAFAFAGIGRWPLRMLRWAFDRAATRNRDLLLCPA